VTDRQTTFLVWGILGATALVLEAAAVLSKGGRTGVGALAGRVVTPVAGRAAVLVAWMWLGWHAFAR